MASLHSTAAPEQRVSAGDDSPAYLRASPEWIEPFVRAELLKADSPDALRILQRRLHRLVDATAASLEQGVPA